MITWVYLTNWQFTTNEIAISMYISLFIFVVLFLFLIHWEMQMNTYNVNAINLLTYMTEFQKHQDEATYTIHDG